MCLGKPDISLNSQWLQDCLACKLESLQSLCPISTNSIGSCDTSSINFEGGQSPRSLLRYSSRFGYGPFPTRVGTYSTNPDAACPVGPLIYVDLYTESGVTALLACWIRINVLAVCSQCWLPELWMQLALNCWSHTDVCFKACVSMTSN